MMIHIYAGKTVKGEEHTAGRELLKKGMLEQYGVKLTKGDIGYAQKGKPYLKNSPGLFFNISHSGEYVICAISRAELGADIERHREVRFLQVGKRFLTEEEWKIWEQSPDPQKYFFDQWVKREAFLKWKGTGLDRDLKTLPFDGWGSFFHVADHYSAMVWTEEPMALKLHFLF